MDELRREDEHVELSEFLMARIAEDEDIARRAAGPVWVMGVDREGGPGRWRHVAQLVALPAADPIDTLSIGDELLRAEHGDDSARAFRSVQHVVRWDPARVLAECDAKRRIVEFHKSWPVLVEQQPEFAAPAAGLNDMTFRMTQQIAWATQEEYRKRFGEEPPTTPMLRTLALPYADHPDYREEWRP